MEQKLIKAAVILGITVILILTFRLSCVTFIDSYEMGYSFNAMSGDVEVIDRKGYVVYPPLIVRVHTIDLRPMQVCISANTRVLNCKLVQFKPEGFKTFIDWHGRDNYENLGSSNIHSSNNLNQILMSYAYDGSGQNYPFLSIIKELSVVNSSDSLNVK